VNGASPNADRQSHRGWNQWGLTLAEVLVALSIITVGLMAMAFGLQQATAFVEVGRQQTIAVFLAQQRLEQIKASALWDFDGVASTKFPPETPVSGYPAYRRTVEISPLPAGLLHAVRVQVTVTYQPATTPATASSERTVSLVTVMSRRR
jgi:prepilin-type N-terminal cleavage/methylation domain-containing protein